MARLKSQELNIIEGPIFRQLILFVLPLIATNLLQVFYSAADMMVVGLSGVEGAIGSIGTTSAMINLFINVFMGFSVGANVIVAHSIGSGSRENTEHAVHTSLLLGVFFGLIGCGIGLVFSRPVLVLLGDEGHILELAVKYTTIYFIGVPFLSLTNYLSAIFRAKGDTTTPLIVMIVAGLLNIGLNLMFVLVFHMDVDGVATATVISNVISAGLLLWRLGKADDWCRFSFAKLEIDPAALKEIVVIGLPAGFQGALFSLSNMIIQSSIISINNVRFPGGSAIIDGNAAGTSLESFVYTATDSVYHGAVTFVSQHYGAGKHIRNKRVILDSYLLAGAIAVIAGAIILILHKPLIGLYVQEEAAVEVAMIRLKIMLIPYFTLGFMEVGSAVLRGYGKSITSMVVTLLGSCVFRIVWILIVVNPNPSLELIYISYPISWALTALAHFICALPVRLPLIKDEEMRNSIRESGREYHLE